MATRPGSKVEKAINKLLKAGRVVFVGVGNILRGDDAVGPYIIEKVKGQRPKAKGQRSKVKGQRPKVEVNKEFFFINAGLVPENYIASIRRLRPRAVVLIDALDFNASAGRMKIIQARSIKGLAISTHDMSLGMFMRQIAQQGMVGVFLLGIQPACVKLWSGMTPEVKLEADKLADFLINTREG